MLDGTLQPQVYRHKQKQGVKGTDERFAKQLRDQMTRRHVRREVAPGSASQQQGCFCWFLFIPMGEAICLGHQHQRVEVLA